MMNVRPTQLILALLATTLFGACGGEGTADDCSVKCEHVQTDCNSKCDSDDCKTKCTTQFNSCTASCDKVTTTTTTTTMK
jgi:hypothetical protein